MRRCERCHAPVDEDGEQLGARCSKKNDLELETEHLHESERMALGWQMLAEDEN